MKKKYLIAVCDLLGFSNVVKRNDLDVVIKKVIYGIKGSLCHAILKDNVPQEIPKYAELKSQSKIGISFFSDTLLLYTLNDTYKDCKMLIETCGWLLFENMFNSSTRLRIGVSYGEAYIDENESIYVGLPIVEACELEKIQEWSGGALTYQAEKRIPEYVKTDLQKNNHYLYDPTYFWWLHYYNVPTKGNRTARLLSIDWTRGIHFFTSFPWSNNNEPTPEEYETKNDIIIKWKNTKKYHEDVCRDCFGRKE